MTAGCRSVPEPQAAVASPIADDGPSRLTITVVDDGGNPVAGTFVRVEECCHTQRGPCGRIPLDPQGRATIDVCPTGGVVSVMLTPDARSYRVAPVRRLEVSGDTSVTLTLTRHESALRNLKPSTAF